MSPPATTLINVCAVTAVCRNQRLIRSPGRRRLPSDPLREYLFLLTDKSSAVVIRPSLDMNSNKHQDARDCMLKFCLTTESLTVSDIAIRNTIPHYETTSHSSDI